MLSAVRDLRVSEESHTIDGLEPYSRYQFALNCSLSARTTDERGPSVYLEETSREKGNQTSELLDNIARMEMFHSCSLKIC